MDRSEIEILLRENVRGVHAELGRLFRGVEQALDKRLASTEKAIARAKCTYDSRPIEPEKRVSTQEGKPQTGAAARGGVRPSPNPRPARG
jgi:hypothetical protein